jgi:hypothetical protein
MLDSLPLSLSERVEYLTLAVANARSHAGTEYARHESAVQFLTDVEERLEVASVQVEVLNEIEGLIIRSGGVAAFESMVGSAWGGLEPLQGSLLTISEVKRSSFVDRILLTSSIALHGVCRSAQHAQDEVVHFPRLGV